MSNPILLMIGDHPRNLHLMNTIIENFGSKNEIQLILQKRKKIFVNITFHWKILFSLQIWFGKRKLLIFLKINWTKEASLTLLSHM